MPARRPVIAMLIGIIGLAMLVPAVHAATGGAWQVARAFVLSGVACLFAASCLALLLGPGSGGERAGREFRTLLLAWLLLPCFAALPLVLLTPGIGILGAWFEMVAALTTTGGTVYPDPATVAPAVHLWRGLVGWGGGLLTLIAAYVVLAPRRLAGFEVLTAGDTAGHGRTVDLRLPAASFESRLRRALATILPVYLAMTVALALLLSAVGDPGLIATVHAMSVVSTSGISPRADGLAAGENFLVEAVAVVFMVAAASRFLYWRATQIGQPARLRTDPELRLMGALVAVTTLALFARHWFAVLASEAPGGVLAGAKALWGAAFTSLSFLTTTGFHSAGWDDARDWSGHASIGIALLALCAIGGGAATAAGGVKLIRIHAMLRHSARELERIARPHSVGGTGSGPRGLGREGAMIAWTFMMLFTVAFIVIVMLLALNGMDLPEALIASTAALSNTGPAYSLIGDDVRGFALLGNADHLILAAAMLLGRIETLAAIVLLYPETWADLAPRRGMRAERTGKAAPEPPLSHSERTAGAVPARRGARSPTKNDNRGTEWPAT